MLEVVLIFGLVLLVELLVVVFLFLEGGELLLGLEQLVLEMGDSF
jgi:hypothetical protein